MWGKSYKWDHMKTAANTLLFDKLSLFCLAVRRMPDLGHLGRRVLKYTDKVRVQVDPFSLTIKYFINSDHSRTKHPCYVCSSSAGCTLISTNPSHYLPIPTTRDNAFISDLSFSETKYRSESSDKQVLGRERSLGSDVISVHVCDRGSNYLFSGHVRGQRRPSSLWTAQTTWPICQKSHRINICLQRPL